MTENAKIRFYCKWCNTMIAIEDLAEIVDDAERVIWYGCNACHVIKMRLDNATE